MPVPTEISAPFWDGLKSGRLTIQRCNSCGHWIFYPRRHCNKCWSHDLAWHEVSGAGSLYTYTLTRIPTLPDFADEMPQAMAVVELDRPEFPVRGFATLEDARLWGRDFVRWYNFEHRHSGIRYVTPAQRHALEDRAILAARHQTYLQARERHPARWSRGTRDWTPVGAVTLNPERDALVRDYVHAEDIGPWLHESGDNYLDLFRYLAMRR